MERRTLLSRGLFILAVGAVLLALVMFKVRVAVAGGKYVLMLAAIVFVVWLVSRSVRK